jgi:hypothetical protein
MHPVTGKMTRLITPEIMQILYDDPRVITKDETEIKF